MCQWNFPFIRQISVSSSDTPINQLASGAAGWDGRTTRRFHIVLPYFCTSLKANINPQFEAFSQPFFHYDDDEYPLTKVSLLMSTNNDENFHLNLDTTHI